MADGQTQRVVDELQTAVREILAESGFDVEVSLAKDDTTRGGMVFRIKALKDGERLTPDVVNSVIGQAIKRIGGQRDE